MLLKVVLLVAVMSYFINSGSAKNAAIFWGVATLLGGLIFQGFEVEIILWSGISFAVAYAIFYVLERLDGSAWYWPTFFCGIAGLLLLA